MDTHRHHPEPPETPELPGSRALPHPIPHLSDTDRADQADRAEALEVISFVDPAVLAAVLGRAQPAAPLLVAARVGVEVADLRHAHATALRDASHAISIAYTAARLARQPSFTELMRRRYPPHGDQSGWARGDAA